MLPTDTILDEVANLVEAAPQSGPALVLYALIKTLSADNRHYLFLLNKLRDLDAEHRELAYRLMELMAQGGNETPEWGRAVARIEAAVRAA